MSSVIKRHHYTLFISVVEMQNVKAELQNGRAQGDASITLESINIEVEPRKDMLNEDDDDEDDQYQDKKPPIGRIEWCKNVLFSVFYYLFLLPVKSKRVFYDTVVI